MGNEILSNLEFQKSYLTLDDNILTTNTKKGSNTKGMFTVLQILELGFALLCIVDI